MNKVLISLVFSIFSSCNLTPKASGLDLDKPKLVVSIVVDQMRFDNLDKYKESYSNNGFNRLIREGFNLKNNHFNYVPTVTGPGHSSISTGSTPKTHGIVGNNWFNKKSGGDRIRTGVQTYSSKAFYMFIPAINCRSETGTGQTNFTRSHN